MSDTAKDQAIAQAQSVAKMVQALECDYDRLEELRDERDRLQADVDSAKDGAVGDTDAPHNALVEWLKESGEELAQLEAEAGDCKDADEARERIQEDALDVQVRSDWYNPTAHSSEGDMGKGCEFMILLCTGGPACRIMGELNEHMEPSRAWIEYQDWGTPWTMLYSGIESSTLLSYCQCFYFGE